MNRRVRGLEAVCAAVLTIAAVALNYLSTSSAGGLWRDEANTVALANLPKIADVWKNFQFDSFPIAWLTFVRGYSGVFGVGNDPAFRVLGFFIGVALIATLWLNARTFGYRFPLVALSLIAVAPSVVRWGDSMRAYGLGMVLIVLTVGAVWRYTGAPSWRNAIAAGIFAMLSVHTIYYNSVLLLAICAGAIVVCIRRRQGKTAAGILGIGFVAAVSLLPYFSTIRGTGAWNSLVRIPSYTAEWFFLKLYETLSPSGSWTFILWITLVLFCLVMGTFGTTKSGHLNDEQKDKVLFATITLIVGTVGSFLFLRSLSYSTQPWYYLTLVLIAGVSMDIIIGSMTVGDRSRAVLSMATLVVGIASAITGSGFLRMRLTNADLVASRLEVMSRPHDLIIVNPWYDGVSFNRYYKGSATWQTIPPISSHALHRYDLVMRLTALPTSEPMAPVLEDAKRVLMSGATVFVVGTFPKAKSLTGRSSASLYVAADESFQTRWGAELAELISEHAISIEMVALDSANAVSRYEAMTMTAVRGWR